MRLAMIAVLLLGLASSMPSDLITYQARPSMISLSGVSPSSALAIDATNAPLQMFQIKELPNIGHYASWAAELSQDESTGLPRSLLNFSARTPELPASVGNASGNITIINDTMVWI